MIRAIVTNGSIQPLDPLPPGWTEGYEVVVQEPQFESDDSPQSIDNWFNELQALGPAIYEAGEREQMNAVMADADRQAKEHVRRQMGLP